MASASGLATAKQDLRRRLLSARRALSPDELETARAAVRAHVMHQCRSAAAAGQPWRAVLAYEALATEPAGPELLDDLAASGAAVFVPVLRPDRDLDWRTWPKASAPLGAAAFEGFDPLVAASVLLIPALAVDRAGLRLGRGGGSYDRVLARTRPSVPVVALLHRGEVLDVVPADAWDRAVSAVVTPDGWFDLPLAGTTPAAEA
ncbi:MAG: 5-formyltetrahydrofolate cyclo-ligase [bacterium]